jgi:hypothetical protein
VVSARKVIPTRPSLLLRLRLAVRAAYLRILIRACEQDIEAYRLEAMLAPEREAIARERRDVLMVELMDCELNTRTR